MWRQTAQSQGDSQDKGVAGFERVVLCDLGNTPKAVAHCVGVNEQFTCARLNLAAVLDIGVEGFFDGCVGSVKRTYYLIDESAPRRFIAGENPLR